MQLLCDRYGKEISGSVNYCSFCGEEAPRKTVIFDDSEKKINDPKYCPDCCQANLRKAMFCSDCGERIYKKPKKKIIFCGECGEKKTLDFVKEGQNVVLAGNPGTRKTHLAIALGIRACMEEYNVLFATIPTLITQLKESRSAGTLRKMEQRFEKYDLVIVDELGYISFDKEGSELLFTKLSLRAGRKSTIITTNLSLERWQEILMTRY